MWTTMGIWKMSLAAALAASILGCNEEKGGSGAPAASTTVSLPAPSPSPSASAPQVGSASATKPTHDCPEGSTGEGSLNKPCEAKGTARLMEVTWTGKITDAGPSFRVVNKAKSEILYGNVVAYFYDKAGKQLEVKDASVTPATTRPKQTCAGSKLFDGVMKAGEKAVLFFSCVKKEHVPDGTAFVEAEMQVVGFADPTGKAVDYYWRNADLTPDERPKGGVKK